MSIDAVPTAVTGTYGIGIGFEGTTTINRKDWGVTSNAPPETGGVLVGEKVTLEFEVSAIGADGSDVRDAEGVIR